MSRRRLSSAAALGVGALAVLAAGIVAASVRGPDGGTAAVRQQHPPATVSASTLPTASPQPPLVAAAQHADAATTPKHHVRAHKPPTVLPFTGPTPVPPTIAFGLLLIVTGAWLLGRFPAFAFEAARGLSALARSGRRRKRPKSGAIERLRSPGR